MQNCKTKVNLNIKIVENLILLLVLQRLDSLILKKISYVFFHSKDIKIREERINLPSIHPRIRDPEFFCRSDPDPFKKYRIRNTDAHTLFLYNASLKNCRVSVGVI